MAYLRFLAPLRYVVLGIFMMLVLSPCTGTAQNPADPLTNLARIQDGTKSKRVSSFDRTGGNRDPIQHIQDGETRTIFDVDGAGTINHIWITIAPPPPELHRNDIILRMYWDGSDEPCVEAPMGVFFGQGWNESYDWSSLPLAAGPRQGRALVSYFAMPFANGARIEIENDTGRAINAFYYYVDYLEMESLPEDLGRFHASYRRELTEAHEDGENEWSVLGPQGENPTGADNYVLADIAGKGHFVGVNYFVHNPSPMWYGEGDDMIFIDGDERPTLHGTGTEDYFNTSWSPNSLFSHPYYGAALVNDGTGWLGRTHVYRFHVTDPIHFDESLLFTIEHGHNNVLALDLGTVAYWYQYDPHKPYPALPDRMGRAPMPEIGPVQIHRWRDAWRRDQGSGRQLWGNEE